MDMLTQEHQDLLNSACDEGDPKQIKATVEIIREALNPHPAGQKTLNAPKKAELTGVQHKYAETVLFFAAAAQTCHAYCTYCFRWAQFIGDADLRFAQKDADSLFDYLEEHEEVRSRRPTRLQTAPKSEKRPPSTFSDGEESRRWREGANTPPQRLSQVSDILFTGGDPMIMKTNMYAAVSSTRLVSRRGGRGWSLRRF